jgi:FdhE protein
MPSVPVPAVPRNSLTETAERRWTAIVETRPDLTPAVDLQRRLIGLVMDLTDAMARVPRPRLSLPPKYLAAKLARGVPALAGEPIPLPTTLLTPTLVELCSRLAAGGAGATAEHIRAAIEQGGIEPGSLLGASLARDQDAIRQGATHRGLAPDLVWLVAELATSPLVHTLQQTLSSGPLAEPLERWTNGYCAICGSWPALAEVAGGHRTLRCSYCASAWELSDYACIYCQESGERFVTAAPDEERKDRRVEVCGTCAGYLKTVDVERLSPFPLLAIADLETMDLDIAAMERGYARPPLKNFTSRR